MQIREPAVANQFYPGDRAMLKQDILRYLASAEFSEDVLDKLKGQVKGLIVPHAGYLYSGGVAGHGFKLLKKLDRDVEWKVVLIGLSHSVPFNGGPVFPDGAWKTPLGEVAVRDIRSEVGAGEDDDLFLNIPEAHTDEHSLEVQLPFLQVCLNRFVVYPLALSSVRPDFLAERLAEFVSREDVLLVVSSDLSHFLPYEEALDVDRETVEGIVGMNIEKVIEKGDACGLKGILASMFLAEKFGWKPVALDYKNSGDTAGDRDRVVGYTSIAFL